MDQVDNFSNIDGEAEQPLYEGPQTRSRTRKLIKANCLMADLFDVETRKFCDEMPDDLIMTAGTESFRTLILQFWYKQAFMLYSVCCDLVEAGAHSIYC